MLCSCSAQTWRCVGEAAALAAHSREAPELPYVFLPMQCCSLLPHGCFLRSQHRGCHVCHVLCWGSDLVPTLLSCWPCCSRSVLLA